MPVFASTIEQKPVEIARKAFAEGSYETVNSQIAPGGGEMLDPRLLAVMRTPPAGLQSEYGMGWMVLEGGNTLAHGGDTESFHSIIVMGLKEKTGFVILCNQNSLFQMMSGHQAMLEGMAQLLNGKAPAAAAATRKALDEGAVALEIIQREMMPAMDEG